MINFIFIVPPPTVKWNLRPWPKASVVINPSALYLQVLSKQTPNKDRLDLTQTWQSMNGLDSPTAGNNITLAFSGLIITEYTTRIMNPAVSLLRLRQGNGAIEDYVVEFLEFSNQVDFNEVALKDIFRVGLNEPIRSGLPGGKIHFSLAEYLDYALLICGSSVTVGVLMLLPAVGESSPFMLCQVCVKSSLSLFGVCLDIWITLVNKLHLGS